MLDNDSAKKQTNFPSFPRFSDIEKILLSVVFYVLSESRTQSWACLWMEIAKLKSVETLCKAIEYVNDLWDSQQRFRRRDYVFSDTHNFLCEGFSFYYAHDASSYNPWNPRYWCWKLLKFLLLFPCWTSAYLHIRWHWRRRHSNSSSQSDLCWFVFPCSPNHFITIVTLILRFTT